MQQAVNIFCSNSFFPVILKMQRCHSEPASAISPSNSNSDGSIHDHMLALLGRRDQLLMAALTMINQLQKDYAIKLAGPLRFQDLNTMSSDLLVTIISSLLTIIDIDIPTSRRAPLVDFNAFGFDNQTYDTTLDDLYWVLKRIFPENGNLLHYSVLLKPSLDMERTKDVLAFITGFVLFYGDLQESLLNTYQSIFDDVAEKKALCEEIQTLDDKIAECNVIRESSRPEFKENMTEKIRQAQVKLAEVETKETRLSGLDREIQALRIELTNVDSEKAKLVSQLTSGDQLQEDIQTVEGLQSELTKEKLRKADMEEKLKTLQADSENMELLLNQSREVVDRMENLVQVVSTHDAKRGARTSYPEDIKAKIDKLRSEWDEILKLYNLKQASLGKLRRKNNVKLKDLKDEVKAVRTSLEEIKRKTNKKRKEAAEFNSKVTEIQATIEACKKDISLHMQIILVDFPARRRLLTKRVKETLDAVAQRYETIPPSPGQSSKWDQPC